MPSSSFLARQQSFRRCLHAHAVDSPSRRAPVEDGRPLENGPSKLYVSKFVNLELQNPRAPFLVNSPRSAVSRLKIIERRSSDRITPFRWGKIATPIRNMIKIFGTSVWIQDPILRTPEEIPSSWLRDHCTCSQCRDPVTAQRKINVFNSKTSVSIREAKMLANGSVEVTFDDSHQSVFSDSFFQQRTSYRNEVNRTGDVPKELWRASISSNPPTVPHEDVLREGSSGMGQLLRNVNKFGFCFVTGMPATPKATQDLLEMIGPIRNTHYGGFYDFTSDLSSKDTAYTSEALEPHTDTTYFTDPVGLQALHILSHTDGSGGESLLVDGFAAATEVMEHRREFYTTLSFTGIRSHASGNEGISIQPSRPFPTFSHHPISYCLEQVRWNNADRAGIDLPVRHLQNWYDAASIFNASVNSEENQYRFQLKPGTCLFFDNWRVLHGRTSFTGKRRVCGGYINRDDWISKYRMTNLTELEIKASTVTG